MYKNLNTGAIGIRDYPLAATIQLAAETGFAGIDFDIREACRQVDKLGLDRLHDLFAESNVRAAQWGLPALPDNGTSDAECNRLPNLAAVGVALGCTRVTTWLPSLSDERPYDENFEWHVERYRPIAKVLAEFGCSFGIEFLGPKTLRDGHKYEFIHTLDEMMKLAEAIGTGNVGLLLDAWHLYTSGGTLDDLDAITADDIVAVHINDAPPGMSYDEMMDNERFLPGQTGMLDLVGFMQKLEAMGYDGPVTTEPFNQEINAIAAENPTRAAQQVSDAMDELWEKSGLQ
jgi:sugar phosphate isomerase/epimerase